MPTEYKFPRAEKLSNCFKIIIIIIITDLVSIDGTQLIDLFFCLILPQVDDSSIDEDATIRYRLVIHRLDEVDFGDYTCGATNIINKARDTITIHGNTITITWHDYHTW